MSLNASAKENFHHANVIEIIHLKYIESAILCKICNVLSSNGKTLNGRL